MIENCFCLTGWGEVGPGSERPRTRQIRLLVPYHDRLSVQNGRGTDCQMSNVRLWDEITSMHDHECRERRARKFHRSILIGSFFQGNLHFHFNFHSAIGCAQVTQMQMYTGANWYWTPVQIQRCFIQIPKRQP